MKKLLHKELRLTAAPITYLFLAFALMTLIPGYPILMGGLFITLGIFYTFQTARESGDILFTALLPCKKSDVVRAKYAFCLLIELSGWLLCALLTALRLTLWREVPVYTHNAMMNANFAYLGWLLFLFALFNAVFLGGFSAPPTGSAGRSSATASSGFSPSPPRKRSITSPAWRA